MRNHIAYTAAQSAPPFPRLQAPVTPLVHSVCRRNKLNTKTFQFQATRRTHAAQRSGKHNQVATWPC